ncbi:RNA polymerase sigma factor [Aureliella helgolandensis]|uniref:RNA polymerase sigma factor n=1 Tax=Aureliella helgolandensis TaxID=2527968 RepID=UPI0011AA7237|nr:sigma-70 family RNA polymerase sigma factor [Aureliella helgolandensis]
MNSNDSTAAPPSDSGPSRVGPCRGGTEATCPPPVWVAQVFGELEVALVAYVRGRLGGNLEGARDVVQEAFVRLCQQDWPEIEPHATAWLYRTCRNRAIDIQRREGRMSTLDSHTDLGSLQDRTARRPDEQMQQGEQLAQVRSRLEQLPDQQQELLRLRLHDGLSYKQIADVTGLTVGNVGYTLHQAISSLRVSLRTD